MKPILSLLLALSLQLSPIMQSNAQPTLPWNTKTRLNSYRPLQPMAGTKPEFIDLDKAVSEKTWKSALNFVQLAEKQGINTQWYALLKHPMTVRQKYSQGYWLKFYLMMDCLEKAKKENNESLANMILKSYFSLK